MKLKYFPKSLLVACLFSAVFLIDPSAVLAGNAPKVYTEKDNGATIELALGESVQFSLTENIPNTTPWLASIPWWSVDQTISLSDGVSIFDEAQHLNMTTVTCLGSKKGNAVIYFYKQDTKDNDSLVNPIIFSIHVRAASEITQ